MIYRIEVEPPAQIVNLSTGVATPLRGHAALLVALALAPEPLRRDDLIRAVWPDTEMEVGRNRLRVALSKFRASHPGLVVAEGDRLGLGTDAECAVLHLPSALGDIESAVDNEQERLAIGQTLQRLGPISEIVARVFPGYESLAVELATRYLEVIRSDADQGIPHALFRPLLATLAGQESFVLAYLDAAILAGEGAVAWAALRPHLVGDRLTAAIRDRGKVASLPADREGAAYGTEEQTLLLALLKTLEDSRPDLLRSLLGSPESLLLSGKHPRAMHDLLERATRDEPKDHDETWQRCMARLTGLKAWLGDADGVLQSAPRVLAHAENPLILRAVWNTIAVAHSLNRNWAEAQSALEKTIDYARAADRPIDVLTAQGNGAFFMMQQGEYRRAYAEYERLQAEMGKVGTNQAKFELALGIGHQAFIPMFERDWPSAEGHFAHAIEIRSAAGSEVQMGLLQLGLACSRMMQTHTTEVESLTRAGLRDAFGAASVRSIQTSLEIVAVTLWGAGDPLLALGIVEWVTRWRSETRCPRSFAEQSWVDQIPAGQSEPLDANLTAPEVGRLAMRRLRQLIRA
ncbi:MAG: hypothetical protein JNJ45_06815 [Chthonomonas sp.]|nr:hypothetical protein [Chthonomonas sp.]